MSTIVTRAGKGSPLTNAECDSNLTNLNTDKVEKSGDTLTGDLAFGDNVKAKFGASDDLQIYHTGSNSVITDVGQGSLYIGGDNNVIIASGNLNTTKARFTLTDVELYYEGAQKFATTSSGVDITGTVTADSLTVEGTDTTTSIDSTGRFLSFLGASNNHIIRADSTDSNLQIRADDFVSINKKGTTTPYFKVDNQSGDISFYEDTGTTAKLTWDASAEELQFKDNVKAEFGDGGDLQIYHNGTNSRIDNNLGNIQVVQNANDSGIIFYSDDGTGGITGYLTIDGSTGEVKLNHYGSQKLATKSTGINVTGAVTADGNGTFQSNSGTSVPTLTIKDTDTSSVNNQVVGILNFDNSDTDYPGTKVSLKAINDSANLGRGSLEINTAWLGTINTALRVGFNNDIAFYDEDSTSQDFYWDASTSRLGLGTTTPFYQLHVKAPSTSDSITTFEGGSVTTNGQTTSSTLRLQTWGQASDGGTRYARYNWIAEPDSSWGSANLKLGYYYDGNARPDVLKVNHSGDVIFYAQDGTTEAFYWDKSTSRLGLGITSPATVFEVKSAGNTAETVAQFGNLNIEGGLQIKTNGNLEWGFNALNSRSLTFSTNQTERMRITSSGSVGIGTTSTQGTLHVASTSPTILIDDTDSNKVLRLGAGSSYNYIQSGEDYVSNSASPLVFGTIFGATEWARFDASGNLGIGTTSPTTQLQIAGTNPQINMQPSAMTENAGLVFKHSNGSATPGFVLYDYSTNAMTFRTSYVEAARIDSSGNLLVGTTNNTQYAVTNGGDAGLCYRANASLDVSRQDNPVTYLNRLGSDGTIAFFLKDSLPGGVIGVSNSRVYLSDHAQAGISFAGESQAVFPCTSSGATNDDATDLGMSAIRWRNLYLSGGVYLGGTGSANLLDDYEEGTFTPSFSDGTTAATSGGAFARYVKTGSSVYVTIYFIDINTTGLTSGNEIIIGNLPFAHATQTFIKSILNVQAHTLSSTNGAVSAFIGTAGTTMKLIDGTSTHIKDPLNVSAITSGATDIYISGTYESA